MKIDRRVAEIDAFDVNSVNERSDPRIGALASKLDTLLTSIFGAGTVEYERYQWPVTNLDTASMNILSPTPLHEVREGLRQGLARARSELEAIRSGFEEELEDAGSTPAPEVALPTAEHLQLTGLHSAVRAKCARLYENGAYAEAVERSFKVVRDKLRQLTGYETGSDAFGRGKLYIRGAAAPNVDADFNEGVKFLLMAIDRFRNEKSHTSDANIDDPARALQYLAISSLALSLLENAEIRP